MLQAVNISHSYQVGTPFCREVVHGVSLTLTPGDSVVLTGPSGSGKTTLARILAGLERPAQGTVRIGGSDLYGSEIKGVPSTPRILMGFQYPERQFFADSVWEELSWGLRVGLGLGQQEISQRLEKVSRELHFPLEELAGRQPRSLSSGQQRKAALVSLLAVEPQVLILDEPLTGLNLRERRRLTEVLRKWVNHQRAMLVIAHELELFFGWMDKVAVLDDGRLMFWGSPRELCESTDSRANHAVTLPALVQISRHLHQHGLIWKHAGYDIDAVYEQVKQALEKSR